MIPNLFPNSDSAPEDGDQQLRADIQFAKKALPLSGLEGAAIPLSKYQPALLSPGGKTVRISLSPCLFSYPSEAKERRRLPLPAHLVTPGHPLSSLLFRKRGAAPQIGARPAASRWSEPAPNSLGPVGEAPGEETTAEPRREPL